MCTTERALRAAFGRALAGLDLRGRTFRALPPRPPRGAAVVVLALGKSAAPMLAGVVERWPGEVTRVVVARPARSLAVGDATRRSLSGVVFAEYAAGHPLPDGVSVEAAEAVGRALAAVGSRDLVLVLLSGGASAAVCAPREGYTLDDVRRETARMLASGASIEALNAVRGRMDVFKRGGIARAARGARVLTLASVDVLGDARGALATLGGAPTVGEGLGSRARVQVVAGPGDARAAMVEALTREGFVVRAGEDARDAVEALAERYAAQVRGLAAGAARVCVGEPTVVLPEGMAPGCRGGRAGRLALAVARGIAGDAGALFLACGTDGVDGSSAAAGAVVTGATWASPGAREALEGYDDGSFHARAGTAVVTGPTGINLLDVHVLARAR